MTWTLATMAGAVRKVAGDRQVDVDEASGDLSVMLSGTREALVIEHDGHGWFAVALAWDASGGISAEHQVADAESPYAAIAQVADFLAEQDRADAALDAALAAMPDDFDADEGQTDLHGYRPPTVPESYDGPDAPRCPECGNYPDTSRVTCLTCLRGPS